MPAEPNLNLTDLRRALARAYGTLIEEFRFIPQGWSAARYAVTGSEGARYFLKLHAQGRPEAFAASSRDFYLPLTYQLHRMGILPWIPHPIPTRDGALALRWQDYVLELTSFVEGTLVGHQGMNRGVLARLAAQVGTLHRSTPQIEIDRPLVDHFEIRFEETLRGALASASEDAQSDREGRRALGGFLQSEQARIRRELDRLHARQLDARRANGLKVICHTDLHGENLMIDTEGHLVILDWECAMIAPPEHDLFFFAGEETFWTGFLPHYEAAFGPAELHPEIFAFYYRRRALEDFTDYIVRIRSGEGSAARDRSDLEDMRDILGGLDQIAPTVETIARRLHARHAP